MSRERLVAVAAVALAVLALGAAAATLDAGQLPESDAERPNSSLGGGGERSEMGGGALFSVGCPGWLDRRLAAGVVAVVVGAGVVGRRRRGTLLPVAVGFPVVLGMLVACPSVLASVPVPGTVEVSPTHLLALAAVGLLGALAVLYVRAGEGAGFEATAGAEDEEAEPDVEAAADAAGRAADRLDRQADLENEVYRAWREMARHLDVGEPATTTPAEFAEAAVAAGMAEADVRRLTRLFEEVRYGEREPAERTDEARETLRRIEHSYGGEG